LEKKLKKAEERKDGDLRDMLTQGPAAAAATASPVAPAQSVPSSPGVDLEPNLLDSAFGSPSPLCDAAASPKVASPAAPEVAAQPAAAKVAAEPAAPKVAAQPPWRVASYTLSPSADQHMASCKVIRSANQQQQPAAPKVAAEPAAPKAAAPAAPEVAAQPAAAKVAAPPAAAKVAAQPPRVGIPLPGMGLLDRARSSIFGDDESDDDVVARLDATLTSSDGALMTSSGALL